MGRKEAWILVEMSNVPNGCSWEEYIEEWWVVDNDQVTPHHPAMAEVPPPHSHNLIHPLSFTTTTIHKLSPASTVATNRITDRGTSTTSQRAGKPPTVPCCRSSPVPGRRTSPRCTMIPSSIDGAETLDRPGINRYSTPAKGLSDS